MEIDQQVDTTMGNILTKYFALFGGLDPKSKPVLIYQATAINQTPNMNLLHFTLLEVGLYWYKQS